MEACQHNWERTPNLDNGTSLMFKCRTCDGRGWCGRNAYIRNRNAVKALKHEPKKRVEVTAHNRLHNDGQVHASAGWYGKGRGY